MRRALRLLTLAVLAAAISCSRQNAPAPAEQAATRLTLDEVWSLRQARDFFTLRDRLTIARDTTSAAALYARGVVEHGMNHPAESNDALARLRRTGGISDSLVADAWELTMSNDLRLGAYAHGAAIADSLLSGRFALDSLRERDARNTQRIFHALAGIPPTTATSSGASLVTLVGGDIPVHVGDSARAYGFDTGANLSVLMRSEAAALGLRVIPAGIDVGSSTAHRVTADLAVAPRLRIGRMEFHDVVFLVMDDAMLTFPGGFRIPGIIGFPVIERMGEIRLTGRKSLAVPATIPVRTQGNLALDELTLLTPVKWEGRPLLCRLDTGAGSSEVYDRFYRKYRPLIDSTTTTAQRRIGGAGGIQLLPVRVAPRAQLAVGDTTVTLTSLDVVTISLVRDEKENYLDCNLGHDVFDQFAELVVNFRDMAVLLQ